jgi:ribosomal protein S27E
MAKLVNKTVLESARLKAKNKADRLFCVKQGLCPDCGAQTTVYADDDSPFMDVYCIVCEPIRTEVKSFLLFKWASKTRGKFLATLAY